jgi:predicted ABC-type ATPase
MQASGSPPQVVIVAGPNGAGKSTAAPYLLRDALRVTEFVNADTIASGLSAFRPDEVAFAAGRIMLERMEQLVASGVSFAFETTLASRSFAPWLSDAKQRGYGVHLVFLWLKSADLAVRRVEGRVRRGGHAVPEQTVRRRYERGLRNLFGLYMPLVDSWQIFDNSASTRPRTLAAGEGATANLIVDTAVWANLKETYGG